MKQVLENMSQIMIYQEKEHNKQEEKTVQKKQQQKNKQ